MWAFIKIRKLTDMGGVDLICPPMNFKNSERPKVMGCLIFVCGPHPPCFLFFLGVIAKLLL